MLLTSNHTHLLNLLFMWKIIAEIHPSYLLLTPTTALNELLANKLPRIFLPTWVTALERTEKD